MANRYATLEQRFWAKVDKGDGAGCWLWTATRWANGYGQFCHQNRRLLAHRVAYELLVGPVPEGMTLDHVRERGCTSKACVKPTHLEPISRGENARRFTRELTHCPQGHSYDDANTYWWQGERHCRACGRNRWHQRFNRKPCLRCDGPKEPGGRRKLCNACKGIRPASPDPPEGSQP